MFLFFYRLFCGYLYVRVTAKNPEKLLNICAAKGIAIWRVSIKNDKLYFKTGIRSFKRLRIFVRKIPCRIHITKKVGFPFFIAKNRKRYGVPIGIILFFFILNFMSGYAWNICISGNSSVKSEEIVASLRNIGIYEGAKISNIDPEQKRNELLLEQKGLSWAAINIEGSKITVDVIETKKRDEKNEEPSNLKASEDGIIREIKVKEGVTEVKVGDTVQKGQLLVSGINEYEDGSFAFEKSQGEIFAEVDYTVTVTQPLQVTEFLKTGESIQKSAISLFGVNIPLYLGNVSGSYETSLYQKNISTGESYLPIELITKKFYITKENTYTLSEQQATERAEKSAENQIKKLVSGGDIISRKSKIITNDTSVTLQIEIKCIKDIVFEEKLQLDTSN